MKLLGPRRKQSKPSAGIYESLDDYQKEAVDYCLKRKTVGLFYEAGIGKTWIAGGIAEKLKRKGPGVALIVVPLVNKETTWLELLSKHFDVFQTWEEFYFITGGNPTRECRFPVLLLHYEAVNPLVEKLRKVDWTLIVYDEAHKLKDRASLQARTAAKLRDSAEYKIILSGTPIESQPQDLWAQFKFLRPSILSDRWKDFEEKWLKPIPDLLKGLRPNSLKWKKAMRVMQIKRGKRQFKFDKLPEFLARIKPYALSLKAEDVLDLPSIELKRIPVKLRGKQRCIYEELEDSLVTEIGKSKVTTPLRIVQLGKLHQVCGGYVVDDDGVAHEVGRAKLRATLEIIRKVKGPVVVFARYLEELRGIADNLSQDYSVDFLIGKNRKRRAEIQRQFQRGETDILLAQYRAGGVGVDLFRAYNGIIYSTTYSSIDFDQAIKRLHRRGQNRNVTIYLPFAQKTVDEAIYEAICSKRKVHDLVLSHLKRRGEADAARSSRVQVRRGRSRKGARGRRAAGSREAAKE